MQSLDNFIDNIQSYHENYESTTDPIEMITNSILRKSYLNKNLNYNKIE